MDFAKKIKQTAVISRVLMVTAFAMAMAFSQAVPAIADDRLEASQLVEKARFTMQNFMCDDKMGAFRDLLKDAHGVLIAPQLLEGAFVVGVSGGNAVFMTREKGGREWSQPAFYTLGGVSFGLQIGGQASEVILLAMTDRGVRALLGSSVKLGGDVGVAAGPIGMGASAATANLSADILSFSRSKGLYGGIALDGAVVAVRDGFNHAFYGKEVTPSDILIRGSVASLQSRDLRQEVARAASEKSTEDLQKLCMAKMPREERQGRLR